MFNFSGMPWWAQLIVLIVCVILLVFVFDKVILPLINKVS